jgi:predicted transposase/invertase (TIGR01784 family)
MTIFDEVYEDGRSDGIEEGIKKGFEKGQIQANIEAAKKMLSMGKFTYDDIAESTSLPLETIKELAG